MTRYIFLLLVSLSCTINCCSRKVFKKVNYEGTVFNNRTDRVPQEGIIVVLQGCNKTSGTCVSDMRFRIGSAITDANGHFKITGKAAKSNYYFVMWENNNQGTEIGGMDDAGLKTEGSELFSHN